MKSVVISNLHTSDYLVGMRQEK